MTLLLSSIVSSTLVVVSTFWSTMVLFDELLPCPPSTLPLSLLSLLVLPVAPVDPLPDVSSLAEGDDEGEAEGDDEGDGEGDEESVLADPLPDVSSSGSGDEDGDGDAVP